jgi:hypothetical protein
MPRAVVVAAAVIDVSPLARLGLLDLPLAGDWVAAMGTGDELAGIGDFMALVDAAPKQRLDAIPGGAIYQCLMLARIPLATEFNLADVNPFLVLGIDCM